MFLQNNDHSNTIRLAFTLPLFNTQKLQVFYQIHQSHKHFTWTSWRRGLRYLQVRHSHQRISHWTLNLNYSALFRGRAFIKLSYASLTAWNNISNCLSLWFIVINVKLHLYGLSSKSRCIFMSCHHKKYDVNMPTQDLLVSDPLLIKLASS